MNSQLNPEAAVFIPPTRLLMMDNAIISASAGIELNEPPVTLPFPSGPKHVDYFMRDNFSTLPNKMKTTSACTVTDFASRIPQEQMEHIPLDKLLAVENINQDIPLELQRASFLGKNKDFDGKESCIIDISENSDVVATDSVETNELVTESEVSGLAASLTVEVSCFQITESASLCKNQAEDDVPINNLDAGEQTAPNLIASQDKPLKSSTQKKKSKSNKNRYRRKHKKVDMAVIENNKAEVTVDMGVVENDNGVIVDTEVIENDEGIMVDTGVIENDEGIIVDMEVTDNDEGIIVDSGVIENNEGFITEYRRSPPIDLTFKPIQTFGDANPFGALQTPSASTPTDYNLSELYKTPVETPEKEHKKIDKFDTITNTPLSFIVTRSPPNESVVPFDELEPSNELLPFVHPPNANRVISDTELPKSLEIQGSDETISSITPESVDVNIDCDDKKDAETTNGNSAKIPNNEEKQEVSDQSEKTTANKTVSNIELDTNEEFLRPEYTINQQKKECEIASKLPVGESLKCETNTFKPEDSNICDTLNPIAEEASFDDIKQDAICELAQVSSMPSVPAHPNNNDQTIIINEVIQDISVEETNSEMQETSFTNEEIHIDQEIVEINHVKKECMETDSETKQHDKDSALKIDEGPEAGDDSKQPGHNETSGSVLDHVPAKSDSNDSDIKADTQQMKLELDSQISNSQTTPEELRNIVQGFEVIDKDELIQDNYSSNLPEKVVPPCQDGLKIERKTEEVVNMNSHLYSNLLKMEDAFKADESRSICNTISFHDDNTSNNNYTPTPHSDNSNEVEQLETSEVSSLPGEPQITETISTQSNIMEMEKNTSDPEETEPGKLNPLHNEDLDISDMKSPLSVKCPSSDLAPNTVVETHSLKDEEKYVPLNKMTEVTPTTETNLTTLLPSGIQKSKTIEDLSEIVIIPTATGAEAGDSDGTSESKVEEAQEAVELIDETVSVASESPKQPSKPANTPVTKSAATKTITKPTSGAKTTPTETTGKTPSMKPTASNVTAAKPTSPSAKPSASTAATSKSNTSGVAALKSTAPGSVPSKSATSSAPPSKSTASSPTTTTTKSTTTGAAPSKPVASNIVSSKSSASSVPSLKNATTSLASSKTTAPGTASTKSVTPSAASTKSVAPTAASTKSVAPTAASTKSVTPSEASTKSAASTKSVAPTAASTKSVAPSAASTKSIAPSATSTKSVAPSATSTKSVAPSAASTKSVTTSAASSKPAAPSSIPAKAPAASTTSSKSTPSSTTAVKSAASSTPAKKPAAASTLKPTTSKTSATSSAKPSVTSSTSVKPVPKPLPVNETTPAAMKSPSKPSTPTSNPTTPTTPKSPLVKMGTAKSPTKPETKFPVLVKTSTSSPPSRVKPLDKKPTTTTDAKLPGKKIEAPKPSTTTAGSKTGSSTTKPQTPATNKTTVSKPTTMPATSTKSKPEGSSDKTSNLDGAKKSTSTGVKTAEKVGNESVSAKLTANAKSTPGKPAGILKTDNKGNTKTGEKTVSSKKPEDEKKEAKSAKVQEHKVSTTNNISQPNQAQPVSNVVTESVN